MQIAEALCTRAALNGTPYPAKALEALWKLLLLNQFHDILPGSSIPEVNDRAIAEFARIQQEADRLARSAVSGRGKSAIAIHNTLSWDRCGETVLDVPDDVIPAAEDVTWQAIEDIEGRRRLVVDGLTVPAFGSAVLPVAKGDARTSGRSAFKVRGNTVETPYAKVTFDKAGGFRSFVYAGRELVRNPAAPLNSLWIGQDVPNDWDNWDIDEDQAIKMQRETRLISREVVAEGPLQLRIRLVYELGVGSKLTQDIVFHATTPRVDFETCVEWNEKHAFLKAGFDVDVFADRARHEIQFGHAFRNTHTNLGTDRAQFECSNHRWSDLSEPGFGVAILNDCKYGISVHGSDMRLSLLKAGTHPDPRGDAGTHVFSYAFLPHDEPFSAQAVICPGYEYNVPVLAVPASAQGEGAPSLLAVDHPAVIVESVKWAEDGQGFIVRLYEAEGNRGAATLRFGQPLKVLETNMLEEGGKAVRTRQQACRLAFRPFEIKTLRCIPERA